MFEEYKKLLLSAVILIIPTSIIYYFFRERDFALALLAISVGTLSFFERKYISGKTNGYIQIFSFIIFCGIAQSFADRHLIYSSFLQILFPTLIASSAVFLVVIFVNNGFKN